MMSAYVVIVLYGGALAILLSRAVRLARLWRQGRKDAFDWSSLTRLARRYLVDVHDRVAREPSSARMHACTAGGFLALILVTALNAVLVAAGAPWFLTAALTLVGLMLVPVLLLGVRLQSRRRSPSPARFSAGRYEALQQLFAVTVVFFLAASLAGVVDNAWADGGVAAVLAVTGVLGLWRLADAISEGPMRHAFAGAVHLVNHPRPARFTAPSTDLRAVALETPRLGAETAADFSWKALAAFDACVQCGRCEQVCPSFAAGLPLNPKKLVADLSASIRASAQRPDYAGSPHPGMDRGYRSTASLQALIGEAEAALHPDTLWACTTCRACVEECPMLIEHVDAIVDMRRHQALERGAVPEKAGEALANLRMTDNARGADPASRMDFATDLKVPVLSEAGSTDTLLWLSDGAFDPRGQRVLRAFIRLLQLAKVDFAVLGAEELDCGDLARRLGDEATFQSLAKGNIATLSRHSFRQIVTTDPHALHCLRNEYPALGGRYTVRHHTDLLNELLGSGRLSVASPAAAEITYHDPCYLGRYNGEFEAPRRVLKAIGFDVVEMEFTRSRSRCCGGGGGGAYSTIQGERRIPDMRMDQARRTGAATVAVACPGCTQMLEGVTGERPAVRDIAELVLEAAGGRA